MIRKIILKKEESRVQAALLEDEILVSLYCEDAGRLGKDTIVKGAVDSVSPSLNAAFVDVGDGQMGYLPLEEGMKLKKNQGIIVQVKREKFQSKGAYLSSRLSLSGRYAVLMEGMERPGVSSRIHDEEERKRLHKIAADHGDSRCGILIRTLAENQPREFIVQEINLLKKRLQKIRKTPLKKKTVVVLHREDDILETLIKDFFDPAKDFIITNDLAAHKVCYERFKRLVPGIHERIRHYKDSYDIFDYYQITGEIKKAGYRKVWLDCGGTLIFDHTEAMTVVDVNTGKNTSAKDFEETAFVTNMEAAREIARQIRLRNIGGIIVVDFIDMRNKKKDHVVEEEFRRYAAMDRKAVDVGGFTRLGMFELTRQKDGRSIQGCQDEE
ncbi:MAG: ribonuclease E/G [Clostridia bacterium]